MPDEIDQLKRGDIIYTIVKKLRSDHHQIVTQRIAAVTPKTVTFAKPSHETGWARRVNKKNLAWRGWSRTPLRAIEHGIGRLNLSIANMQTKIRSATAEIKNLKTLEKMDMDDA